MGAQSFIESGIRLPQLVDDPVTLSLDMNEALIVTQLTGIVMEVRA